ncbi:MAG: hypothetical protein GY719_43235 [bacterium]|nr:hypothetical protein [bacterium]
MSSDDPPGADFGALIAGALRLIRTRAELTQTAASKLPGAPDFRTISHWETRRKLPSLRLLIGYLRALDLDLCNLQEALDQISGREAEERAALDRRLIDVERRLAVLERSSAEVELFVECQTEEDPPP